MLGLGISMNCLPSSFSKFRSTSSSQSIRYCPIATRRAKSDQSVAASSSCSPSTPHGTAEFVSDPHLQAHFSKARSEFFRHPWFEHLRSVSSLSNESRILTFLTGNTTSGNMAALARDWAFLPASKHALGAEAILLGLVTAGMPKTLIAFSTVSGLGILSRNTTEKPISVLSEQKSTEWYQKAFQKGEERLKSWRGLQYPRLRRHLRLLHPALDRMMVELVFGRVIGRGVLAERDANLCTLMGMTGRISFPQLHAFLIDIVSSGSVTVEEARAMMDQCGLIFGDAAQSVVDAAWTDIPKHQLLQKPAEAEDIAEKMEKFVWTYDAATSSRCTEASVLEWEKRCKEVSSGLFGTNHVLADAPYFSSGHGVVSFRQPPSLSSHKLTCALLGAHSAAGNLTLLAHGWSTLPREYHQMGLEAILQSSIFGGFFNTVNALETVHRMGVAVEAIDFKREDSEALSASPAQNIQKGKAAMSKIYTKMLDPLLEKIGSQHPDLVSLIVDAVYGRILSRSCDGLSLRDRELWAILAMSGTHNYPQLHSHMLGALHCGATLAEIRCVLDQTQVAWGRDAQAMVDAFWLAFERAELRRVHPSTGASKKK